MADEDGGAPNPDAPPEDETQRDREKLRTKRQRARATEEEDADFWRSVFADAIGRRVMWDVLRSCHAFEERFACGPNGFPQPEATWFEAGQQAFGLRLYRSWMRFAPEGLMTMMRENDPSLRDAPKGRRGRVIRGER